MFLKINDCIKNNRRNSTKVSRPLSWTAISQKQILCMTLAAETKSVCVVYLSGERTAESENARAHRSEEN